MIRSLLFFRHQLKTRCMSSMSIWNGEEFTIDVPWGVIAGRKWGDPKGHPWFGFHGWLDNAGTFDNLAPLLPLQTNRFYCIDLPGNGYSSPYPRGFFYHFSDVIVVILKIAEELEIKKFGLLGHSMGAGLSSVFTSLYPELITHLIMLDLIRPFSRTPSEIIEKERRAIDGQFYIEKKMQHKKAPVYTYDEALNRLMESSSSILTGGLSKESAEIMLKRGLMKSNCGKGHVFTRDPRWQVMNSRNYTHEILTEFMKRIRCPFLIIKTEDNYFGQNREMLEVSLEDQRNNNPGFVYATVKGTHHVHLERAHDIAPIINEFINKSNPN